MLILEEVYVYIRENNLFIYLFFVLLFIFEYNVLSFIMYRGEDFFCFFRKFFLLFLDLILSSEFFYLNVEFL